MELHFYLTISACLFTLGTIAIFWRNNLIAILMGVELVLNASGLNFVAFSKYTSASLHGQIFALFIIVIAAAEAAVALALVLRFYQSSSSVDVETANKLRH
ncbi:MAG: NADH-quinone oxidoreductase subunit NuoK [Deltaproteobacteria bacterium]|nr:NADH-quinone oxidoreductase subunit NuoK [Deltaproteobacteria bacterium]